MDLKLFYTNWWKPVVFATVNGTFLWIAKEQPQVFTLLQDAGINPIWVMGAVAALVGFIASKSNPLSGKEYKGSVPSVETKGEDPELVK